MPIWLNTLLKEGNLYVYIFKRCKQALMFCDVRTQDEYSKQSVSNVENAQFVNHHARLILNG